MAVFTFSTKSSRPDDTETINKIKRICIKENLNFSAVVVDLLKEWEKKHSKKQAEEHKDVSA